MTLKENKLLKLKQFLNNSILFNQLWISRGFISQQRLFSKLAFPIKLPVTTEVRLDFEEDTKVRYLSSIKPFPLGSKPLQPKHWNITFAAR